MVSVAPVPQGLLANLLDVAHTTAVDPVPYQDRRQDVQPARAWSRAALAAAAGVAGVVVGSVVVARRPRPAL